MSDLHQAIVASLANLNQSVEELTRRLEEQQAELRALRARWRGPLNSR